MPEDRFPKKPGQHEELERLVLDLIEGQCRQEKAMNELAKIVGEGKPIDVQFSWPMDHELMTKVDQILGIVKSIRHAQGGQGGLSPEQEAEQARILKVDTDRLSEAVAANQPEVPPPVDAPAT